MRALGVRASRVSTSKASFRSGELWTQEASFTLAKEVKWIATRHEIAVIDSHRRSTVSGSHRGPARVCLHEMDVNRGQKNLLRPRPRPYQAYRLLFKLPPGHFTSATK